MIYTATNGGASRRGDQCVTSFRINDEKKNFLVKEETFHNTYICTEDGATWETTRLGFTYEALFVGGIFVVIVLIVVGRYMVKGESKNISLLKIFDRITKRKE